MSSLFPLRSTVEPAAGEPKLVGLDEGSADDVFDALSAETTRSILVALYEEPRTASELAESVDTSLQNVQYHVGKLRDADLVEVADTWYSERGTEMKVYAPTSESLVLFAGDEEEKRGLRSMLGSIVGALGLLGLASVAVDYLVRAFLLANPAGDAGGRAGGPQTADAPETIADGGSVVAPVMDAAGPLATPGVLFFLGGLTVLLAVLAAYAVRAR